MTTATLAGAATDVNATFDDNRRGQILDIQRAVEANRQAISNFDAGNFQASIDADIASRVAQGLIRDNGNGTYTSLTGWDANETFRIQVATRPEELTLVLPESGLNGNGYFAQDEWHGEGFIEVGGSSGIEHVLRRSGLAYDVMQKPVRYFDRDGTLRTDDRHFVNYRDDTGDALGVVGTKYVPFQNSSAFAFLQELVDDHGARFQSAAPLDDGRRVFISVRLPEDIVLDIPGLPEGDVILPYVCVFNTHDGSGLYRCVVTPYRPRCKNTERLGLASAWSSWGIRHTRSAPDRATEARRQLGLAGAYFERFKADEEKLARTELSTREVNKVIAELEADLWPLPAAVADGSRKLTPREAGARDRRNADIKTRARTESREVGQSLYTVERAFTGHLDHGTKRVQGNAPSKAAARNWAILEGADDDRKTQAHKLLLKRA